MAAPTSAVIGIDFGTTNTVVSLLGPDGTSSLVRFEAPAGEGAKHYKLTVLAGTDQHDFDIAQVKVAQ